MHLTDDDIQDILRLLDTSFVNELHLKTEHFSLTLRRSGGEAGGWTQETHNTAPPKLVGGTAKPAAATDGRAAAAATPEPEGSLAVRAPMIGTFYRAPKPGALPFVEVGETVTEGTVVGIVEAMKLMNSVYAGAAGVITEICTADGQFVEQDHVLMRLRAEPA